MIRYAFYTYVDELVRMSKMTASAAESLIVAYAHLRFLWIRNYADTLNKITNKHYQDKRDPETIKLPEQNHAIIKQLSLRKDTMIQELSEYIKDCVQVAKN